MTIDNSLIISNKNGIAHAFNRAANSYHDADDMQQFAGRKLIQQLDKTMLNATILDLGCGNGFITEQLIKAIPFKECHAIDIAEDALLQAKKLIDDEKIYFLQHDFDQLPSTFSDKFSLIFSNMALHWSNDFTSLLNSLQHALIPHGTLAFSVPLQGTLKELQPTSIRSFYHFTDIIASLKQNDFIIDHALQFQYIKRFDRVIDALYSLKKTGVTHFNRKKNLGLLGKKHLEMLYQAESVQPILTYEVGIFIGRKP